jgi:hypothetical protein
MKEAPGSSETLVLTRVTRRNNSEDIILRAEIAPKLIPQLNEPPSHEEEWKSAVSSHSALKMAAR